MLVSAPIKARFVEPMLLRRTDSLPDGTDFAYEVKLDGYRALGIKTDGKVHLRSRNNKDFNSIGIQASPERWEHYPTKQ